MGPRKLASTCSPGRWWGRDPVTSRSRVTRCAYRWTYLYAVVPICSGPTLGVPPSTFPSAKARAWFHKFCWDVEWYPIAILRKEISSSRSHDWPQSFHWVHKPRQGVDFWLFRRASLHDLSPSLSLEMFHHALWKKKIVFPKIFRDDWVVDEFMTGYCHFPTAWISQKVLWKVTHASALILTVWINHLIWHITHHLYMYIIIENVSIKKNIWFFAVLIREPSFLSDSVLVWEAGPRIQFSQQFPIIAQEIIRFHILLLPAPGPLGPFGDMGKYRKPWSGLDDLDNDSVIFTFPRLTSFLFLWGECIWRFPG